MDSCRPVRRFSRTKDSHDRVQRVEDNWISYNLCPLGQTETQKNRAFDVPPLPSSQIQAVRKHLQLLLSEFLLLLQVLLPDEQRGFSLDEAAVVLQLLG